MEWGRVRREAWITGLTVSLFYDFTKIRFTTFFSAELYWSDELI